MSKVFKGGTDLWCPHCLAIRVCSAENPSAHGVPSGQRWRRSDHSDIQWFRRRRTCHTCWHSWLSAEVPECFITELAELRNAFSTIKAQSADVLGHSQVTTENLSKLESSLKSLSALH